MMKLKNYLLFVYGFSNVILSIFLLYGAIKNFSQFSFINSLLLFVMAGISSAYGYKKMVISIENDKKL